jgi:hypothetical protein
MNNPAKTALTGLIGFSLIVVSAFTPWFQWAWHDVSDLWYQSTAVWGPPAYVSALPDATYAIVAVAENSQIFLSGTIGLYLLMFLVGTGLWIKILWTIRPTAGRWLVLAGGIGSIMIGGGVVIFLGLAEVAAQRTGLYAAIATDQIIMAEMEQIQLIGPLILLAGTGLEIMAIIWSRRVSAL